MTRRIFLACTGGGAGAQQMIWRAPGCSEYFAGAVFPYGEDQIDDFLGFRPERFCSEDTAIDLAMAAYMRAWNGTGAAYGVGLTAVTASSREHRGGNRAHAAMVSHEGALVATLDLGNNVGSALRLEDGALCDQLALGLLDMAPLSNGPKVTNVTELARLRLLARPYFAETGRRTGGAPDGLALYPGAFNPPHNGHLEIADKCDGAVFSITADPPHKPRLELHELLQRAKLLKGSRLLLSEGDALYIDKARRHPGRQIVIGADALVRMLDPKWGPEVTPMLEEFERLAITFLVFGRSVNGEWMPPSKAKFKTPPRFTNLFQCMPGRWDLSSTELREAAAQ